MGDKAGLPGGGLRLLLGPRCIEPCGCSVGPHTHFEVILMHKSRDPGRETGLHCVTDTGLPDASRWNPAPEDTLSHSTEPFPQHPWKHSSQEQILHTRNEALG